MKGLELGMLFFILIFAGFFLEGCSTLDDFADCAGNSGNYEKNVNANTYYSFKKYEFENSVFNDDKNKTEYQIYNVFFKEILELFDDSAFTYNKIWEHHSDSSNTEIIVDTVEYMSGTFSIRPVDGEKWHSFVLKSDSLFIRWRLLRDNNYLYADTYAYNLIIDEQYHSEPFIALYDSVLLNVDARDSCFTLARWYQEPDDMPFSCSAPYAAIERIFCANTAMKDSSIVGIISK